MQLAPNYLFMLLLLLPMDLLAKGDCGFPGMGPKRMLTTSVPCSPAPSSHNTYVEQPGKQRCCLTEQLSYSRHGPQQSNIDNRKA